MIDPGQPFVPLIQGGLWTQYEAALSRRDATKNPVERLTKTLAELDE